jgi:hypothetical protein
MMPHADKNLVEILQRVEQYNITLGVQSILQVIAYVGMMFFFVYLLKQPSVDDISELFRNNIDA